MSRIDEAWRRASGQEVAEEPLVQSIVPAPRAFAPDETILARYVVEQTVSVSRPIQRERSHPIVSTSHERTVGVPPVVASSARGKLVVTPEIEPASIEQYRRLAATLDGLQSEGGLKSLMVSSALPREGKTLTVANLALTLSESYRRKVLLIDADFHRPSVHELFGIANSAGLAGALHSSDGRWQPIQVSATLSVLPAGRIDDSATAALSSDRLRTLVASAASSFDWVLLDTPPVGMLTDAHLVARATDGVLFVIAAGMTPYALVQRSLNEIGKDRIVGTVLNRIEEHALPVRDYYHRQYSSQS
jgi:capsular exopolysaccharide synthesis family protein